MGGERIFLSFETAAGGIELLAPRLTVRRSTARPWLLSNHWNLVQLQNLNDISIYVYLILISIYYYQEAFLCTTKQEVFPIPNSTGTYTEKKYFF